MRWFRPGRGRGCNQFVQVSASASALFVPCQLPDRPCFLSLSIVLTLRGELDYTNLEVMQLGLFSESHWQLPSAPLYVAVQTVLRGPSVWTGLVLMLLYLSVCVCVCRKDDKDYALKQIEGTGISMSACREIAVRAAWLTLFLLFGLWLNTFVPFQALYVTSEWHSHASFCQENENCEIQAIVKLKSQEADVNAVHIESRHRISDIKYCLTCI